MEICSESEDHQISKLNEFSLVAYKIWKARRGAWLGLSKFKGNKLNPSGGSSARTAFPTSNKNSLTTDGSFDPPVQGSGEALSAPSSSFLGGSISKEGKIANQAPANSTILEDMTRCQLSDKVAQAGSPRSDGESRENRLQQFFAPIAFLNIATQTTTSTVEASGRPLFPRYLQKEPFLFFTLQNFFLQLLV
jgi:hypothetical protein